MRSLFDKLAGTSISYSSSAQKSSQKPPQKPPKKPPQQQGYSPYAQPPQQPQQYDSYAQKQSVPQQQAYTPYAQQSPQQSQQQPPPQQQQQVSNVNPHAPLSGASAAPLSDAPLSGATEQTQPVVTRNAVNLEDQEEDEKIQVQFMSELDNVVRSHFTFMKKQEENVNKFISSSGANAWMLENANSAALETEKALLQKIMKLSRMNDFLKDIILIENLFNSVYTEQLQSKQKEARNKYAPNLSKYETTNSKPITKATSFVDLLFYAKTDLSSFRKWVEKVVNECNDQYVRIVSNSGAKEKNIERAFYKSFYVYSAIYGDKGHQQMTDVLRCSLVFDDFADLYKCFTIIEKMSEQNGGILRAKDRFNPKQIPFGYRDILININCPKSDIPIICEVQLHHSAFYKHKKVSHNMYKIARIFEDTETGDNLAYKYADQYIRREVGDKIYGDEHGQNEDNDAGDDVGKLLSEWGLSQYTETLIENGYDDIEDWKDLTMEELMDELNFKKGHAKKFMRKVDGM